jgi:hypothetical protein
MTKQCPNTVFASTSDGSTIKQTCNNKMMAWYGECVRCAVNNQERAITMEPAPAD